MVEPGKRVRLIIDVGVIGETGRTAVVEVNDGYALGRYGLDPDAYVDLPEARWRELLA
jgi:ATP-grasp domain, R2K clade family 2